MYYRPRQNEEVKADTIYPVTIVKSRYQGCYEDGKWLAFNCDPDDVSTDVWDGDVPCSLFFDNYNRQTEKQRRKNPLRIGRGDSPQEALKDLAAQFYGY